MSSLGATPIDIDTMATADTSALYSPLMEQLPAAKDVMRNADARVFFTQEQLSLQEHLAQQQQQGQMMDSPSYVCKWMPTNLRLPSQVAQQNEIYLCLPVHMSETSYFKQKEEKEEYKDDGYCSDNATQLRLLELDRYLAAIPPLASSTQTLLFGAPVTQNNDSNHQMYRASLKAIQNKVHQDRRSKYERQSQLLAKEPRSSGHRLVTSTNSGRVINILQGEIAHCTPFQADVLVSDDATTCHIVALWSRYLSSEEGEKMTGTTSSSTVLATMTHIDGPGYETSIRDAVNEHIKYHSIHSKQNNNDEECKENCTCQENCDSGIIEMSIHILGGFNDHEGSSIEITDNVLQTFAALSNEYNEYCISRRPPYMRMTLETCAVTSANDDGAGCPLGRGLGMEVATGNIFLAEIEDVDNMHGTVSSPTPPTAVVASCNEIGMVPVDSDVHLLNAGANVSHISAQGPAATLRSIRLWASAFHSRGRKRESRLNVIYRPNRDNLCVEPFFFGPHSSAKGLLGCSDEELLHITSTSPEVEKSNFASKVRQSLTFMNGTMSSRVFTGDQPMQYQRVGLNGWVRIS